MRIALVLAGFAVILTACQTASYQGDTASPYFVVPQDSRLTLNREITFYPDQLSVYVQDGQILPISRVQVFTPFCKFELRHRHSDTVTIAPGEITVTDARQEQQYGEFSRAEPRPRLQVATIALVAQMGGGQSPGGSQRYTYVTRMDLRSREQPEIFRLTCARASYPGLKEQLSIAEIRGTLSPLFTLRLPGQS